MNKLFVIAAILWFLPYIVEAQNVAAPQSGYVLVVHGGAGTMTQNGITPAEEEQYKQSLKTAIRAGEEILARGGTAVDAVQAAIMVLEDDTLFNAGRGSALTSAHTVEMDAAIMDGKNLAAGAVAGVSIIKNPVTAARKVMDKGEYVMMAGNGAEAYAKANGCVIMDPSYFFLEKAKLKLKQQAENKGKKTQLGQPGNIDSKYGTVGAVALDKKGNLAAATSTGGMSGKKPGRIGDSPIIGAGTYADNASCAVSCTGWGEYFIRLGMAKSVCDRVELQHVPLQQAARTMIHEKLQRLGSTGGLIGVDKNGNITMQFNTNSMHRAWVKEGGERGVELFKD